VVPGQPRQKKQDSIKKQNNNNNNNKTLKLKKDWQCDSSGRVPLRRGAGEEGWWSGSSLASIRP
jgi:hypothetical protein